MAGFDGIALFTDPPVVITNQGDEEVQVQWQTLLTDVALSRANGATVAAATADFGSPVGLTLFGEYQGKIQNVLIVSVVADEGRILSQAMDKEVMPDTKAGMEAMTLHIEVAADLAITLSLR